jgi:hypothetical protein
MDAPKHTGQYAFTLYIHLENVEVVEKRAKSLAGQRKLLLQSGASFGRGL